jgi:hypothetical protein
MSRILAEHGLNKSSFSLEDVSQAPQQCEIELHNNVKLKVGELNTITRQTLQDSF